MAAPGPSTNLVSVGATSTVTSITLPLDAGTSDKWACVTVEGQHVGDSLTVDTPGWVALTPVENTDSRGATVMFAYKPNASDTSVAFSWNTAASAVVIGGHQPDTDFSTDSPTQTSGLGSGTIESAPSATWTPVGTDVRVLSLIGAGDARRVIGTYPDPDNNFSENNGEGSGSALLSVCSGGVTADSPYAPGDWVWSGNVTSTMLSVVFKDGGVTASPLSVWDGVAWVSGVLNVWDGAAWVPSFPRIFDGGSWVPT